MSCARSVLLILMLLAGSLSPPPTWAQQSPDPPGDDGRGFYLEQNYPNPVNPETWIPFQLEQSLFTGADSVSATIRIFNILSQVVAVPEAVDHPSGPGVRIVNLLYRSPGRKIAFWDGNDTAGRPVPSGVYYCQLVVRGQPHTRKLIVLNSRRRNTIFPWFGGNKEDRPR